MMITPPEPTLRQIRDDVHELCKIYIRDKEALQIAKDEVEENRASIKVTLEYLRCEYELEDLEEIERIANNRNFVDETWYN